MFGYVIPLHSKLTREGRKRYKAAYCGLCHTLGKSYGFRSRFLVNYDMTFLYFLLSREKAGELTRCSCPAKPFCKRDCIPCDPVMEYAADLTVLLSWWKLRDALSDGSFFKKIGARLGLWLYRRPYAGASARRREENGLFERQLALLSQLERERCSAIDRVADTFATLLRGCAGQPASPEEDRILQTLLYHVGRYLYLADALEDLPEDVKHHSYNPLALRYEITDGKLSEEDRTQLIDTIEASVSIAASALELLPYEGDREILENIIYEGLPAVLQSICKGTFRKRRSKNEGSV